MTDIFTPETPVDDTPISSYRERLVGEGKKFKDDEALARGKYEADLTIARREAELAEVRKELNTRITLEEFLTKQKPEARTPGSNNDQPIVAETIVPKSEGNTAEQFRNEARSVYQEEQIKAQRAANAQTARQKLKEAWGDSAVQRLEQVSRSLGVGKEFLQDLAERSPEAFLNAIGAVPQKNPSGYTTPPASNRNSGATLNAQQMGVRNEAYYDKLKVENPKWYYSIEGYNARDKDALALGADYFN